MFGVPYPTLRARLGLCVRRTHKSNRFPSSRTVVSHDMTSKTSSNLYEGIVPTVVVEASSSSSSGTTILIVVILVSDDDESATNDDSNSNSNSDRLLLCCCWNFHSPKGSSGFGSRWNYFSLVDSMLSILCF